MDTRVRLILGGVVTGALLVLAPPAAGQQLTLERIFASPDFRPEVVAELSWLPDDRRFSFVARDASGVTHLWAEDPRTGERTRFIDGATLVPPGASRPIDIEGYAWSPDGSKALIYTNSQRVWRRNTKGTYFVYDRATGRLAPVSGADGWQQFAKFSPDGGRVGFVRNNDLFVVDLATGAETRLTRDGNEVIINGTFDWVYEEELGLRDGWRWSPDGRRIAFWQLDQSPVETFYMVDELDGQYTRPIPLRYPKAGESNSRARIGVVDVAAAGGIRWLDVQVADDGYIARMEWAAPGELVIQRLNRHQNRLDVLLADATTGRSRLLFAETDSAWVDVDDDLIWVQGGRRFLWTSERDGYNHIYLYNRDGSVARQLTKGPWDVQGMNPSGDWVYFSARAERPTELNLYRLKLDGSGLEGLSEGAGSHTFTLEPGPAGYVAVHSRADAPPVTRMHGPDGRVLRVLEDNAALAARLAAAGVRPPEFFTFRTSDGVELNGWMIKPPDFDPARRYPVLMYVYGGPGSQTATNAWGGNRALWHQLLARRGYIVASVDNRGTGSRGRAFKKMTYLNLGKWESSDQIEAARHLASLPYVDGGRIGIWGWSYGGYMSALTMMRGGELFRAGISVAPVTDWRLYDTIYTERFMRTPQENPEGYRESAPLQHAAGLRGALLVVHGTGDDNVHSQNTTQLVDTLQRERKQFSLMIYPNRTHSISGGNTQLHLYTLMTDWVTSRL